jgi:O-antigen ligase
MRVDDIMLVVIFIGWLAKLAVYKELSLLKRTAMNGPILAYIFVCVLSTAVMLIGGRGQLLRSAFYLLKYFEYYLLYFLVVNNVTNLKQAKVFIYLLLATCFIVSLYGLFSYFATGVRASAPFEGVEGEANTLAGYLVFMIALALGLLLYSDDARLKTLMAAVIGTAFITMLFTLSRSGWLSFIFMYLAFIVVSKKGKPILVFGLVFMIVLAPIAAPKAIKERVSATFHDPGKAYRVGHKSVNIDESGVARIESWKIGFRKLSQKPIFGFGIPGGSVIDNQYARVMMEVGFLGFFVFLYLLWRIFTISRRTVDLFRGIPFTEGIAVGFFAGFCGLLFHSTTSASFIVIRIMEPFWFLMAIIVLLPELVKTAEVQPVDFSGT